MKYDPNTKRVQRDASDRERHRQIRERLTFPAPPTATEVTAAVDALVDEGLLPADFADRELKELGHALRDERQRQGLSVSDLAAKSGLDEAAIADLEIGRRTHSTLKILTVWANALGKRLHLTLSDA
jgi:ribosome-binding protein aMBF1 (putative translation factor)